MKKQWKASADGGGSQFWCATGKELFYRKGEAFLAVPVETDPELKLGTPRVLFSSGNYASSPWHASLDGKRFLLSKQLPLPPAARSVPRRINIILNWTEELKQRIPSP
jgi:hypothetical protein